LESVELLTVTGSTKETSPASVVDNKVHLNLKMFSLGDAARYKVVVKNISKADYRLSKNDFEAMDGYIKYSIEIDDEDAVVKPNQVKEVTLLVEYAKEKGTPVLEKSAQKIKDQTIKTLEATLDKLKDSNNTKKTTK
jgi:hypothetical protein